MTDTVAYRRVADWWNGRVLIDEIKMYTDSRGMVSEVWRIDSLMGKDSKQCYISETAPYIQRGPHQHSLQVDEFVSWKNHMVYQMYNPDTKEMKTFTTEKNKIFRVHVDVGIIHSYRNLDKDKSFTLNFPTSLFKGVDKKEDIDEIRHEEKYTKNDVIVVFGAAGKLGKAITNEFYSQMSEHKFDLIPVYEKLRTIEDVQDFFPKLDLSIMKNQNVYFINCASLTNVQDVNTQESIWEWSNVELPLQFAKRCNDRNWRFAQFSSDYVFQEVEKGIINYNLSSYTRSKVRMEHALKSSELKNTIILRVSNLYADEDINNCIYKMKQLLKNDGIIKVDPRIKIYPSYVNDVAKVVYSIYSKYIWGSRQSGIDINLVPKGYYLPEFVKEVFGVTAVLENGKIKPWHFEYESSAINYPIDTNPEKMTEVANKI